MWNGTAATLKPKPISSRPSPSEAINDMGFPASCAPMSDRLVVPVTPYTSAIPYSRNPDAKAPIRKYLRAASDENTFARL